MGLGSHDANTQWCLGTVVALPLCVNLWLWWLDLENWIWGYFCMRKCVYKRRMSLVSPRVVHTITEACQCNLQSLGWSDSSCSTHRHPGFRVNLPGLCSTCRVRRHKKPGRWTWRCDCFIDQLYLTRSTAIWITISSVRVSFTRTFPARKIIEKVQNKWKNQKIKY